MDTGYGETTKLGGASRDPIGTAANRATEQTKTQDDARNGCASEAVPNRFQIGRSIGRELVNRHHSMERRDLLVNFDQMMERTRGVFGALVEAVELDADTKLDLLKEHIGEEIEMMRFAPRIR